VLSMRARDPSWARSASEAQALARGAAKSLAGSFGDRFPSLALSSNNLTALTEWPRPTADGFRATIASWLANVISDINHEILLAEAPDLARVFAEVTHWLKDRGLGHLDVHTDGTADAPSLRVWSDGRCLVLVQGGRDGTWLVTTPDVSARFADVREALVRSDIHGAAMDTVDEDAPSPPGP